MISIRDKILIKKFSIINKIPRFNLGQLIPNLSTVFHIGFVRKKYESGIKYPSSGKKWYTVNLIILYFEGSHNNHIIPTDI